jgi:uncharacterized protein (TIGR00290 family)
MQVAVSWSSGKDSAHALYTLQREAEVEVVGLLTTVAQDSGRVAMHGTRRELLAAQAAAIGLPLIEVPLPYPCSNADYERAMRRALAALRERGVTHLAFGDLFLSDIRRYRETLLAGSGVAPLFPLWGKPTRALVGEMLASGLRAIVSCVELARLSADFVGRPFDAAFLAALPEGIDPCGENGEFHTCVIGGPPLRCPLSVSVTGTVKREGLCFAELVLAGQMPSHNAP